MMIKNEQWKGGFAMKKTYMHTLISVVLLLIMVSAAIYYKRNKSNTFERYAKRIKRNSFIHSCMDVDNYERVQNALKNYEQL